ncbi:MAG TPA: DUF4278 domain-containing protein [Leptolyngbyaceae cyanobacterium M65_K2018_010]|nr:DUF4278 domain-containing protein [Leptolyngbyaceae cyanobacterium M65_K2018_010]
MKLTYRGVDYDYTPNPAPKWGQSLGTGHYRGSEVTFRAMAELPAQPAADLTWRGVDYRSGIAAVPTPTVAVAAEPERVPVLAAEPTVSTETATPSIYERARNLFIRRHQRSRRREQGMMVRLAAEVGLPVEEAAHYESHIQGKLPHDFSAYDRSSTAMS